MLKKKRTAVCYEQLSHFFGDENQIKEEEKNKTSKSKFSHFIGIKNIFRSNINHEK